MTLSNDGNTPRTNKLLLEKYERERARATRATIPVAQLPNLRLVSRI